MNKKEIRRNFRNAVFTRDKYTCVTCGKKFTPEQVETELDAHHITDRNQIINGGYVMENGASLCKECHMKAEEFHRTGKSILGFSPEDLYSKIGSSLEMATKAAELLQ